MVLIIVLLLVLAAFGLLVAALTTANTLWAWASVVVSLVAAGILVVDWLGNRKRKSADRTPANVVPQNGDTGTEIEDDVVEDRHPPVPDPPDSVEPARAVPDPGDEPAEEATDAADLLVVSDLQVDVRVLDERPRYHLPRCPWLGSRSSIGLPVAEARQLGFTPCGVCTPDEVLAARDRAGRGARQTRSETG